MYKLIVQSKAQADADRIIDYIRYILFNNQAALEFVNCLEKRYRQIADNPHAFTNEWIDNRLYKKATVKRYLIIYRINEQTHTVYIIAIGHGLQKRRNIVKGS